MTNKDINTAQNAVAQAKAFWEVLYRDPSTFAFETRFNYIIARIGHCIILRHPREQLDQNIRRLQKEVRQSVLRGWDREDIEKAAVESGFDLSDEHDGL